MRMRTLVLLFLVPGLLLPGLCPVYGKERFTNVAALLEIGAGARPLGMGGAFVGLADDENAVFYNPAALAFLDRFGVTSLYSRQLQMLDYKVLGIAGRFAGLTLLQLYSGGIEGTNRFGNPDGTSFSYTSRAGIASAGIASGRVSPWGPGSSSTKRSAMG